MKDAITIFNSIMTHAVHNTLPNIQTLSKFSSIAFKNTLSDGDNTKEISDVKYIVCGYSLCGSNQSPTGEVCGE